MEHESRRYSILNQLSDRDGIVIFGGEEDLQIPVGELQQAFSIESKIYNRSFPGLSIIDAPAVYDSYIAPLNPKTVLLHIGESDLSRFEEDRMEFDSRYRTLIRHIRTRTPQCRIAVISLKNTDQDPRIGKLNKQLNYIAQTEQCDYGDLSCRRVWNPENLRHTFSFLHAVGLGQRRSQGLPVYDLTRILFCFDA